MAVPQVRNNVGWSSIYSVDYRDEQQGLAKFLLLSTMSKIKVIITTSLRPSRRTRTFTKELSQLIPGALRITRGKLNFQALHALSVDMGAEKLIVVDSSMGNPSRMVVYAARPNSFEKVC